MKTTQVNLRLEYEAIATLDAMAGKGLNRQAVARMLLIAAIEAVQANGGKIHLPPKFTVDDGDKISAVIDSSRLNEPHARYTTSRKK